MEKVGNSQEGRTTPRDRSAVSFPIPLTRVQLRLVLAVAHRRHLQTDRGGNGQAHALRQFFWRSPDGARSPQRPRSYSRWPHRGARCDGGGPGPDELTQATLLTQTRAPSGERLPILHLLGIDLIRLIYKFQGREFRLTDMHGRVVQAILA
jgi:Protein of unknown function (DUF1501)